MSSLQKTLLAVAIAAVAASAAAPVSAADDDAWHGSFNTNSWLFVNHGSVTVRGQQVDVDTTFKDAVDALSDVSSLFAASAEFGKGRYRGVVDFLHLGLEVTEDIGPGLKVKPTIQYGEAAFAYRSTGEPDGSSGYFDLLFGARVMNIEVELNGLGPLGFRRSGSQDTVQPFLGVRGDSKVSEKWHWNYRVDIGGFQQDDSSLQAYLGMTYHRNENWFMNFGIRALRMNYEDGSGSSLFEHRLTYIGPQLGGGYRW